MSKLTENKTKIIQVRLTEYDYNLLKICAKSIGQDCSKLVRMYIDSTITPLKIQIDKGEIKLEDYNTLLND